jgi:hypothetical protein
MRFFEYYSADGDMVELSEAEARTRDTYAELIDSPLRHYRTFFHHELERVSYPESSPSPELVTWHRESYPGIRFWVVSPITYVENEPSYTIWYYAGDGTLEKRVEYENRPLVGISRWFHPDGRLGGSNERRFHEWGEHIETITRDETGRIVSIDD